MENKKPVKMIEGKVVSTAMQHTVVVSVIHEFRHPIYRKAVKRMRTFHAHNADIALQVGDLVKVMETKPISKKTHYTVVSKIR